MASKGDFKDNPVLSMITNQTKPEEEKPKSKPKKAKVEEGRPRKEKKPAKKGSKTIYVNGQNITVENKSQRVQLLTTPSLHAKIKKQAKAEGLSVNELINKALIEYTEGR